MSTPESKVKVNVKKELDKFYVWYHLPVSMGYGQHGIPDFICCGAPKNDTEALGIFFTIETKANGRKPTALQAMQMQRIRLVQGPTFVIDENNLGVLIAWLQLKIQPRRL